MNMSNKMKCPVCGGADLISDVRDQSYTYKGQTTIIAGVSGDYCPACNEGILNIDECRRVMDLQLAFNNKVNALL
jgi:HTH-type transcriptional regulator / antitoxin MqsA